MDINDGKKIEGTAIHSSRVTNTNKEYICKDLVNIHLQYYSKVRNRSKQRWYKAWELVNNNLNQVELFRQNNKTLDFPQNQLIEIDKYWTKPLS